MKEKRDIVFLLGAGSTVDAGLPTAIRLAQLAEHSISKEHIELLPVFRFICGAIQFGQACRGESISNNINIEELLAACSFLASREISFVYPFVAAWHERISELEKIKINGVLENVDTFDYLARYCKQKLREWLNIDNRSKLKYLRSFKDFINKKYRLRIFTLNYDECLECVFSDELGEVNSNWTSGFDEKGWNPELLNSDKYTAYIYKLHGSLDWADDEKIGICSVKWPPAEDSEEISEEFDPLLIFGGRDDKLQAVDPFLTLLFHFQQTLNVSDILVTVGYGFGDTHVNAMILEALQRDPQKRCIIVNTNGIDNIFPEDSDFMRLLAVEERFIELKLETKRAFDTDKLLEVVEETLNLRDSEPPF